MAFRGGATAPDWSNGAAHEDGERIRKARGPFSVNNRGEYQLLDGNTIIGGVNFDMSIDEILSYINELGYRA